MTRDIYWGDGIYKERLPLLEAVPEEDEENEISPEEIEQLLDEFYTNLGDEE